VLPELEDLILRCLAKEPDHRPQSARELAQALRTMGRAAGHDSGPRKHRLRLPSVSFEDDATESRIPTHLATAPTATVGDDRAAGHYRDLVLQTAATLRDAGDAEVALITLLAQAEDLRAEIQAGDVELASLEDQIERIEHHGREREAALRFALGELGYHRSTSPGAGKTEDDVARKARELEALLTAAVGKREADLRAISDREVMMVAELAEREDRLKVLVRELDRVLEQRLTAGNDNGKMQLAIDLDLARAAATGTLS
jgi:hypothetical protein